MCPGPRVSNCDIVEVKKTFAVWRITNVRKQVIKGFGVPELANFAFLGKLKFTG